MKLKLEGYKQASLAVQKMNYAKDKRNKLLLNVYQKNARAISFYKREGFEIQHSGLDEATGEKDYVMTWQHKQTKIQLIKRGAYAMPGILVVEDDENLNRGITFSLKKS